MDYKANLKYENQDEVCDVIDWLNDRYKLASRSFNCEQQLNGDNEIIVTDETELIPYGIFEVGNYIGQKWMSKHYRITIGNWNKRINRELFNDEYFPQYEKVKLELMNSDSIEFSVRNALIIGSSLDIIKPYMTAYDFQRVAEFCEFKTTNFANSKVQQSKEGLSLNYHILDNQLLIFGTKTNYTDKEYEVNLIAAFEINIPNYAI